jgi:hypothetical protein
VSAIGTSSPELDVGIWDDGRRWRSASRQQAWLRPWVRESSGLPVWSRHVGDPILERNLTRRVDFALFMVEALENDELVHEAPAIVGCQTPSALAHAASE